MNDNGENGLKSQQQLDIVVAHRADWERNHRDILNAYLLLFQEKKGVPTMEEVAERCNLSRNTVWRHSDGLKLEEVAAQFRLRATSVLHGIASGAEKGDASCARLYAQLVFGWKESTEISGPGGGPIQYAEVRESLLTRLNQIAEGVERN